MEGFYKYQIQLDNYSESPFLVITTIILNKIMPICIKISSLKQPRESMSKK